jgi:lycopene beta-cyclase
MDFRPAASDAAEPPSFLYMLPFSDERVFVEETSLARRPAVSFELLGARLERRLSALGLERAERIGVERCAIPMGLALPARGQPLIPFGAAASMVHPASGYSIAHALRKAPVVAAAIVEALQSDDPTQASAAGNAAVWPHAQRSAWELYTFGLETLLSMGGVETGRFFSEFFELPHDAWSGFLSGQLPPTELVAVMTRLFRRLPAPIRWHLVRTGMSAGAAPLARTVLQTGLT